MDHVKAVAGTGLAWGGVALSFVEKLTPILQVIALCLAITASITTIRLNRRRSKQIGKE
jgi:hypothetical protein